MRHRSSVFTHEPKNLDWFWWFAFKKKTIITITITKPNFTHHRSKLVWISAGTVFSFFLKIFISWNFGEAPTLQQGQTLLSPSSISTANCHPSGLNCKLPTPKEFHLYNLHMTSWHLAALCYNLHRRGALASWLLLKLNWQLFWITPVLKLSTK